MIAQLLTPRAALRHAACGNCAVLRVHQGLQQHEATVCAVQKVDEGAPCSLSPCILKKKPYS